MEYVNENNYHDSSKFSSNIGAISGCKVPQMGGRYKSPKLKRRTNKIRSHKKHSLRRRLNKRTIKRRYNKRNIKKRSNKKQRYIKRRSNKKHNMKGGEQYMNNQSKGYASGYSIQPEGINYKTSMLANPIPIKIAKHCGTISRN